LTKPNPGVVGSALCCISNIAAGTPEQLTACFRAGAFGPLVGVIRYLVLSFLMVLTRETKWVVGLIGLAFYVIFAATQCVVTHRSTRPGPRTSRPARQLEDALYAVLDAVRNGTPSQLRQLVRLRLMEALLAHLGNAMTPDRILLVSLGLASDRFCLG